MIFIRSGNFIWLTLGLVVLLSLVYWYIQPTSRSHESPPTIGQLPIKIKERDITVSHQEPVADSKIVAGNRSVADGSVVAQSMTATDIKQNLTVLGTPADAAEIEQWYRERGKFFGSEDTEYKNHNEAILRTLADGGDIRALHELANRYTYGKISDPDGSGVKATNELYWKAAVYGSTEALLHLGINKEVLDYSDTGPERENRKHALEILSLYNTAALRGDVRPNIVSAKDFKFLNHIELSEDEKNISNNDHRKSTTIFCKSG
jgi:hypothetical protein